MIKINHIDKKHAHDSANLIYILKNSLKMIINENYLNHNLITEKFKQVPKKIEIISLIESVGIMKDDFMDNGVHKVNYDIRIVVDNKIWLQVPVYKNGDGFYKNHFVIENRIQQRKLSLELREHIRGKLVFHCPKTTEIILSEEIKIPHDLFDI